MYDHKNNTHIVYNSKVKTMNDDILSDILKNINYTNLKNFFDEWFELEDYYDEYDESKIKILLNNKYISIDTIKTS